MADTLVNTLYPPAVETFQPAFIYTDGPVITFSISPFNAAPDIKYVHVSVTDQRNNENVLKGSLSFIDNINGNIISRGYGIYNGLLVSEFPQDEGQEDAGLVHYDSELDLYSISIPTFLLRKEDTVTVVTEKTEVNATTEDGENVTSSSSSSQQYFNVGQYYKIQLRFDKCESNINDKELEKLSSNTQEAAEALTFLQGYMVNQRPYFSEWSTVTLVKPVLPIHVYFPQLPEKSQEMPSFNKGLIRVAARVWFADTEENTDKINAAYGNGRWEENEHLERYRIKVYQEDVPITDTEEVYAEPTRVNNTYEYGINYILDLTNAAENTQCVLVLEIWSNNDYYYTTTRTFTITEFSEIYNSPKWHNHPGTEYPAEYIEVNQEDGVAIIDFSWIDTKLPPGNLYIKRACSKDNFKKWDIISVTEELGERINLHLEDYTICSLHKYRYAAQYEQIKGPWSKIYYSNTIYPKFYEMLLERQNRQIAIRYNGQVTSWKPTINRQKIDTLGGKYPKFVENAQMNYKQFSVQGLISAEADFNRKFLNEFQGKWVHDGTKYEYQYDYQRDIISYDEAFNGVYGIRNDTYADGEFGYNSDELYDLNKQKTNNEIEFSEDKGNKYWSHETARGRNALPRGYTKSIFSDIELEGDSDIRILQHQHDLYPQDNWYWEREFREQLIQWLNDGEPKLYRSMPEGNVAVILTDISLTPITQLGRRLYQFTATMYEVGDGYSLESLDKLGIINIPKLATAYAESGTSNNNSGSSSSDSSIDSNVHTVEQVGQLYYPNIYDKGLIKERDSSEETINLKNYIWDNIALVDRINNQYKSELSRWVIDDKSVYLKDVRIQFCSKPHWYIYDGNNWSYLPDQKITQVSDNAQVYLGYILYISYSNGTTTLPKRAIFVNEKGYYQVPSNTFVKEIRLYNHVNENGVQDVQDRVIIDYILHYNQSYNVNILPSRKRTLWRIIGQWGGMYPVNTYVGPSIYEKYNITQYRYDSDSGKIDESKFVNFAQRLDYWQGISVDVSPYSVIGIKYQNTDEYQTIVVGHTGVFSIMDDAPTDDIVFLGRKMFLVDRSRQPYLDEWEYTVDESIDYEGNTDHTPVNWFELQNTQIVDSGDRVVYYFAQQVNNEEDADIDIPIGMEHTVFQQWVETHASDPVDISHPEINRVYPIRINNTTQNYIYYIDYKWYPISIIAEDGTALAAVPVYGYINYIGNIVRSEYN